MPSKIVSETNQRLELEIKRLFRQKAIKWDPHALTELDADKITTDQVKAAIDSCEVIETYWTHGHHSIKCLIYMNIPGKPHAHLVVMLSDNTVYIKTGYIASDPKKFKPDGKTRIREYEK